MSNFYRIAQPASGVVLGVYEAQDEFTAIDALAQDQGYRDADHMDSITGEYSRDQLDTVPVDAIHWAYQEYQLGSQRFVEYVEAHCGYDMSRDEIKRLGAKCATAEEFEHKWENDRDWIDSDSND